MIEWEIEEKKREEGGKEIRRGREYHFISLSKVVSITSHKPPSYRVLTSHN